MLCWYWIIESQSSNDKRGGAENSLLRQRFQRRDSGPAKSSAESSIGGRKRGTPV
jgi:hypothetical protein